MDRIGCLRLSTDLVAIVRRHLLGRCLIVCSSMSYTPRITLRLLDLSPSSSRPSAGRLVVVGGGSLASSWSHVAGREVPRGVLLPLPPTIGTLKAAAMEQAQADPQLKQLMQRAKAKRRQERAKHTQPARHQKKAKTNGVVASTGAHQSTGERKADDTMTDVDGIADREEDDEDRLEEPDSEDESSLPSFWPFSWRFYIDGGEVKHADLYQAIVRDRDCIDAELLIHEARGQKWIEFAKYIQQHKFQPEPTTPQEETIEVDAAAGEPTETDATLRPAPRDTNPEAMKPTVRDHTVSAAAGAPAGGQPPVSKPTSQPTNVQPPSQTQPPTQPTTNAPTPNDVARKPAVVDGRATFHCCSRGCNKPAALGPCPHCAAIGMKTSFFCSQECYAENWTLHSAQCHPQTA